MNQLAYEPSFHPGSFLAPTSPAFNGPAYHQQGYPQPGQSHSNQAFAHPGQQRQYHDGASYDFQKAPPQSTGAGVMQMQPSYACELAPPSSLLSLLAAHCDALISICYLVSSLANQSSIIAPPANNPYNSPVPAQAPYAVPQNLSARQSATPPQRFSPNAASQRQPSITPPTKYPMAAPPLPQTPAHQQQQASLPHAADANAAVASPKTPQSPGMQSREQQRIALLLSINIELLAEVNRLQQLGQGGAINPQQAQQLKNAGQNDKMASEDYIQCLRRVQANLAYMMPKAQQGQHNESKVPPGPAHMTAPSHLPELKEKYDQLKELFPDWQGLDHRLSQSAGGNSGSPRPNSQTGNANGMSGSNASTSSTIS